MNLPNILHATITLNPRNRVVIKMDSGWKFYDREHYKDLIDDNGEPREPTSEEINYFDYGVYALDTDFEYRIVVVEDNI